jgi:large subunit ribosomal protein L13
VGPELPYSGADPRTIVCALTIGESCDWHGTPGQTPRNRGCVYESPFPPSGWGSRLKKRRQTIVRTYSPKPSDVQRQWHVVDATDLVLGRMASQVATLLRGKHKPYYAPHIDTGDFVIVVNADKVALTGKKLEQKKAYRHSGYPGGLRSVAYVDLLENNPERAIEKAVKGMLPKGSLGRQMAKKLKVYAGAEHPHQAQQPVPFAITKIEQPA